MFIKLSRQVRVFVPKKELEFLYQIAPQPYFFASKLAPEQMPMAKILADKSILVRKKLDNDVQYALNKEVVRINRELKEASRTRKTD